MHLVDLIPLIERMPRGIEYRLVGTAAAAVQGVRLPVGDIDLLFRRRAAVDLVAAALGEAACVDAPRWMREARQYFARFVIGGTVVELSTVEQRRPGLHECVGRGPWDHYTNVRVAGLAVPAVRLELRLATELSRGRDDRVAPLRAHLAAHGCDVGLLRAALAGAGIPRRREEAVVAQCVDRKDAAR